MAAYTGQDLINYQAGNEYLPREYYSLPYEKLPPVEEEEVTQNFGIPYTSAFTGSGGGGGAPINYQTGRNYRPGGKYERNPLASGALDMVMNAKGEIVPNPKFGSSMGSIRPGYSEFSPLEMSYMSKLPQSGQDLSRFEQLNLKARDLLGVNSAYASGRKSGKISDFIQGIIPFGRIPQMLGAEPIGDWSPRHRWAVEGGEWGTGTGRDEFGVYTGGKTLMGKTADYKERMKNRVSEIKEFLASGKKNKSMEKQLLDYQTKLGILDEDEQVDAFQQQQKVALANRNIKKAKAADIDVFNYNIHGDGEGAKVTPPKHPPSTWTPAGGNGGSGSGSVTPESMGMSTVGGGDPFFNQGGRAGFFYGGLANIL